MGREAQCEVRFGGRSGRARVLLETDDLIARGEVRLTIPYRDVTAVAADGGWLRVAFAGGEASFGLGAQAEIWAHKITHPVSLLDKLGVKAGRRVRVVDVPGETFIDDLRARTGDVYGAHGGTEAPSDRPADIVFVGAEGASALEQLHVLKAQIVMNGAIWVVFPKGRKDFKDTDVMRAGAEAGLVDVKVVRFSDTHTGIKLVYRVKDR